MLNILKNFNDIIPTNDEEIRNVENQLNFKINEELFNFLLNYNSSEAFIGENSYIRLIPVLEIVEDNNNYEIQRYIPHYILFATNGASSGYCFDIKNKNYVAIDLCSIREKDSIICGKKLEDFLMYLYNE